ncbi:hypothetical protein PEP31012_00582 [Pandoraea eparura]|jgi:hypothetical protein|uniref:Uncharacterized protein n=1 Tax=Pandoraea eparura TaxID=2508291 RepID=A0A5E4S4W4_9BURK|nr:hypothetical protein PEP31012_00582 [Pandoraea eparura]
MASRYPNTASDKQHIDILSDLGLAWRSRRS